MQSAIRRIKNDLKDIRFGDCINTIGYAEQKEGDPLIVEACVIGPRSTRYEDDLFVIELQFPNDYPFSPPAITFISGTNHPYILFIETLLAGFLQKKWTPIYTIKDLLENILLLLRIVDMMGNGFE